MNFKGSKSDVLEADVGNKGTLVRGREKVSADLHSDSYGVKMSNSKITEALGLKD